MLAASAALLGTLPWRATRVVLPAMVRDRVGEELRAAGFPHAALHIERVTLGAVVLTDVQLDSTLHIERVQATLDWTRARVDAVEVEGLRWMVEASATGLRDNALARLLDRDGEHADGGVAPLLRLDDARVTLRHGDRRWSARVDGTMNPAARRGRLRLRHDERGPYELEVRFDQGAGATTLHTHLRSLERDEPDSETALADARLDLPLRWRDRQLSARGQVEARALAWREPPSARAELRMAAAGPITSLAIGVLGTAGALAMMGGTVAEADDALRMMAGLGPLGHAAALAGTDQHSARALQLGAGLPASASRYARTWPT